jgi:hypothetical protein
MCTLVVVVPRVAESFSIAGSRNPHQYVYGRDRRTHDQNRDAKIRSKGKKMMTTQTATNNEGDKEHLKERVAMKTSPIVSEQEWERGSSGGN